MGDLTNMAERCSEEAGQPSFQSTLLKCAGAIGGAALISTAFFTGSSIYGDFELRQSLNHNGVRVHGTMTGFEGKTGNIAEFRFSTTDGRAFDASYSGAMSYPERERLSEGMKVDIVYDPSNPTQAIPAPFPQVPLCDLWAQLVLALHAIGVMVAVGLGAAVLTAFKIDQQASDDSHVSPWRR